MSIAGRRRQPKCRSGDLDDLAKGDGPGDGAADRRVRQRVVDDLAQLPFWHAVGTDPDPNDGLEGSGWDVVVGPEQAAVVGLASYRHLERRQLDPNLGCPHRDDGRVTRSVRGPQEPARGRSGSGPTDREEHIAEEAGVNAIHAAAKSDSTTAVAGLSEPRPSPGFAVRCARAAWIARPVSDIAMTSSMPHPGPIVGVPVIPP